MNILEVKSVTPLSPSTTDSGVTPNTGGGGSALGGAGGCSRFGGGSGAGGLAKGRRLARRGAGVAGSSFCSGGGGSIGIGCFSTVLISTVTGNRTGLGRRRIEDTLRASVACATSATIAPQRVA